MSQKLNGKIAVVTGGTSGIGLATAKRFAAEGARVFITGRRKAELDAAVAEIGRTATGVQADASRLADLDLLFQKVKADAGRIEQVLVNLAVNARDAMSQGGTLRIVTSVSIGGEPGSPQSLPPGEFVTLTATDTGCGSILWTPYTIQPVGRPAPTPNLTDVCRPEGVGSDYGRLVCAARHHGRPQARDRKSRCRPRTGGLRGRDERSR
jgi:hypothetical protein